ncbi:MAG: MogA/MoaB family molybdenum cofactor biosynthesis protein [Phycisphaerae bacterium]|nr:MogA/MoaB family molybdenum cofactor biosynthesis protein [Phycisphaerae bacterium]MDW8261044.1 MogA/MoaB family molybdenum cofactor biosynthesis protein [Phycisphaerales bacterium]
MSADQHRKCGKGIVARCAVITLSDTRNPATDASGSAIQQRLCESGHTIAEYRLIRDEPAELRELLRQFLQRQDIDAIITTGGTGLSRRDQTVPVVEQLIETPLPGFGELFRMLSFEQVGPAAMLSRAIGGVACGKLLFALPGSPAACELAMSRLIGPELGHLLSHIRR